MALECGCIAQNCTYCDDNLRVIPHQKANLLLPPLNGYHLMHAPNNALQPTPLRVE
jgi:hypothetical protein